MNSVKVIIGNGYGDEGKGLMTDYYASLATDPIVVRFNGGSQAGHSVQTVKGSHRHIFSHFGSGSFAGASTFLSRYFVNSPMAFKREFEQFTSQHNGPPPPIFVDSQSIVTLPFDILINQAKEQRRGVNRHGSVGVGFGETIERNEQYHKFTVSALRYCAAQGYLKSALMQIRREYVMKVIAPFFDSISPDLQGALMSDILIDAFVKHVEFFFDHVIVHSDDMLVGRNVIFEGAQGLMLDMYYGHFPHVTRSQCGMANVRQMINPAIDLGRLKPKNIEVNYITRSYATRHGVGPLENENKYMDQYNIVDPTNVKGEFQGELRIAPLNISNLNAVAMKDFMNFAPRDSRLKKTITCVDQIPENDVIYTDHNNNILPVNTEHFKDEVVPFHFDYASYGPTKQDIRNLSNDD
jgi:adenylosuccinate synthase